MANVSDYESLIYAKAWELLEGDAEVAAAIKVGNRIRFDKSTRWPVKTTLATADLPQLTLDLGGTSSPLLSGDPVFGMTTEAAAGELSWLENDTITLAGELVMADFRLGPGNQLFRNMLRAWRAAGPLWGFDWLKLIGPVNRSPDGLVDGDNGAWRRVIRFTLRFVLDVQGEEELTDDDA